MNFTCDKNLFLREVSIAQEIISSKNAISILSNVLLEIQDDSLIIKATDIKVNFESKIPVQVTEQGSTTVYCDKLLSILRSIPDGDVHFIQDGTKVTIQPIGKKVNFQLKSIASEKFPEIPLMDPKNFFEISQKDFRAMIDQTIFAVSDDETRYFMNGVYLEKKDEKLAMVATDGRRLSIITKAFDVTIPDFKAVIIPPKALVLVSKMMTGEGNISLAVSEKNVFFYCGNENISTSLIDGQFPNYQRVIPENQQFEFSINRVDVIEALKRVSLLVEQKSRRVFLKLMPNTLNILSEESDIGQADEDVVCVYEGPEAMIALNYVYLLDPLKVMQDERVTIQFTETTKAITILPEPTKDFFHIVMPMQLE
jgi:DNA polymerase III subunit beta